MSVGSERKEGAERAVGACVGERERREQREFRSSPTINSKFTSTFKYSILMLSLLIK